MQYNRLGSAGLKISELSYGSWLTFGDNVDVSLAKKLMREAFSQGVNFFDNAEVYGNGQSERIMGEVLGEFQRDEIVVSTKVFFGTGRDKVNTKGLSRKHIIEGTKAAIQRLQLEYVDLVFCHRPDPETPIIETVRAMHDLISQGYAFYWGTSEWSAAELEQAYCLAEKYSLIPPTMEQPQYNLLWRKRVEQEYLPLYKQGLGTTIWSPLASGLLTGKYNNGVPSGSRLAKVDWLRERMTKDKIEAVKELSLLAEEVGIPLSQFSIAWCLSNPNVSTVILGASSEKQLKENIVAASHKKLFNEELKSRINQLLAKYDLN